jgi:histidinol-phosphate phosphatase family protein
LVIGITNQSAVARGIISEEELFEIHKKLLNIVPIDAIYYCPHLYNDHCVNKKYFIDCGCRKPKPGMILKACGEYRIDLLRSFFIGDRLSDILCGKNAGIKTVWVRSGFNLDKESTEKADYSYENLLQFVTEHIC